MDYNFLMRADHEGVCRPKKNGAPVVDSSSTHRGPFGSVEKFSPNDAIERTFRVRFSLPQRPKPGSAGIRPKRAPRVQELLRRAEEYRRMLDRESGLSLRKLAGRLGLTAPRLCQILNLLKLSSPVRRSIAALPPAAGRERMTEYSLRRIAALAPAAQMRTLRRLMS